LNPKILDIYYVYDILHIWYIMRNNINKKPLSNVEFALLQLISEEGELSGYMISRLVEEREYREWADIGDTSIYTGLEKLNKKGFVRFYVDTDKQGKGPLPKKFNLTDKGKETLKREVLEALSATRERDQRFDIALAAIHHINPKDAQQALEKRKSFLTAERQRINSKFLHQDGPTLPRHVQILFKHPIILIGAELEFMDEIVRTIKTVKNAPQGHPKF
jgi:DNA-binding PadR family transcriptional regulator